MSDFLKGFSRENYNKEEQNNITNRQPKQSGKPERDFYSSQAGNAGVKDTGIPGNSREELFEKDPESGKKKKKKILLIISLVLAVCFLATTVIYFTSTVSLPDFVGGHSEQAQVWAVRNNIYIEVEEEYNLEYDRGFVVSQSPPVGENLFKGHSMELTVSKGADPGEQIELPDFSDMKVYEIQQWTEEKRADNVNIIREYDEEVPADLFIKKEFRDSSVTEQNYKREDRMTITVSRGPEVFEKDIEVPDFKEKPEAESLEWANSRGIELHTEETYSDEIPEKHVINQSISPETKIARNEELTITVSKGKAVYAPCFSGLSREEAEIKATESNVIVSSIERYNENIEVGRLISQSVQPGTLLEEEQNTIVLYYSKGLPYIPDLTGQNENEAVQMLSGMNNSGANLSYKFEYVHAGDIPRGTIIFNNPAGIRVSIDSSVIITVSKGGRLVMKDYVNNKDYNQINSEMMQNEITRLESQGLKVTHEYVKSSRTAGTIISQSIKPGREINTAEHILILQVAN